MKMESFQIETASRNSLQEIMINFRHVLANQDEKIARLD